MLHRASDDPGQLIDLVDELMVKGKNDRLRGVLNQRADKLKAKVEAMWDEVISELGLSETSPDHTGRD